MELQRSAADFCTIHDLEIIFATALLSDVDHYEI
jgi:hypothetical protein